MSQETVDQIKHGVKCSLIFEAMMKNNAILMEAIDAHPPAVEMDEIDMCKAMAFVMGIIIARKAKVINSDVDHGLKLYAELVRASAMDHANDH